MKRLNLIKNQIHKNKTNYDLPVQDYNPFYSLLNNSEKHYLIKLRNRIKELYPIESLIYHNENEIVPIEFYKKIVKEFPESLNGTVGNGLLPTTSNNLDHAILVEFGKVDAGFLGVMLVHGRLNIGVIDIAGSKEQREKLLPEMAKLQYLSSFCLTEKDIGSEAHNMNTTFTKTDNGFIINGNKRWVGNADDAELLIVFAKEAKSEEKKKPEIKGFLIYPKKQIGVRAVKLESKQPVRIVHNCDIYFDNVLVTESNVLPGINSFDDVSKFLVKSRLLICNFSLGILTSALENVIQYSKERVQFNKQIGSFQLIQEKIVYIKAHIDSMFSLLNRVNNLSYIYGCKQGQVSMCKAFCGNKIRECLLYAREIFGGNGILYDYKVMKMLLDSEAIIIVEGTFEINLLACGKEITGISSYYNQI